MLLETAPVLTQMRQNNVTSRRLVVTVMKTDAAHAKAKHSRARAAPRNP